MSGKYQFLRVAKVNHDGTFVLNDGTILEVNKDEGGPYVQIGVVKFYVHQDQLVGVPERQPPNHD